MPLPCMEDLIASTIFLARSSGLLTMLMDGVTSFPLMTRSAVAGLPVKVEDIATPVIDAAPAVAVTPVLPLWELIAAAMEMALELF